ncbi:uncharacterized protein BCR38DRAFT_409167 [Pseudomassariella vexata]|uniref:Sox C-terminal domain-containing protein n=1 Tax=Pseudomassariella vexata TaxID=1141098 RepID=A0A1Y2E3M9_9PEZI|nr:uncharacterized protein BCR38DRAFT_409167 [Pseudomassariella vexata]ORY65475.1 hypothetical protein BCR38DRAFT_409167 [Pseudomassariella vexata]
MVQMPGLGKHISVQTGPQAPPPDTKNWMRANHLLRCQSPYFSDIRVMYFNGLARCSSCNEQGASLPLLDLAPPFASPALAVASGIGNSYLGWGASCPVPNQNALHKLDDA